MSCEPLVEEYRQLEAADAALSAIGNATATAAAPAAAPRAGARARARRQARSGTGRRGRPRGSGTRAAQALELVRNRPGSPSRSWPRRWASSRTTSTA